MAPPLQTFILFLSLFSAAHSSHSLLPPSDAVSILHFKSKADLADTLPFSNNTTLLFCKWKGVQCHAGRVIRLVLQGFSLRGIFASDTLCRLQQLRVLSLQYNSLTGAIPDLSGLINLKTLFLDHNSFSGTIPPSISSLHRLRMLDLSCNNLTGTIPPSLNELDRLYYLRLDANKLNGSIPPLNISTLQIFNVSGNVLSGPIPVTPTLIKFSGLSFSSNPNLCGEIIKIECKSHQHFFEGESPTEDSPPPSMEMIGESSQLNHGVQLNSNKHKRTLLIISFSAGLFALIISVLCFTLTAKKQSSRGNLCPRMASDSSAREHAAAVMRIEEENDELEEKVKMVQGIQMERSGCLTFCAGESQLYTLEQLLKASAELLGKGVIGTTYKAVLDNSLIVSVKRLESSRLAGTSKEQFERRMESVGGLRHPNLVPLRAYFQAKEEKLLVYDYQPNGSLFSLLRGSRSTRAKPLHWTSCLKIAEDIAHGLSYIHQAWRLVHGNLKSTNILLGSDFEACITDYCLSTLNNTTDSISRSYLPPEARKPYHNQEPSVKSDIYAFGVLLVEILTGKSPNEHPDDANPDELVKWVRSVREDHDGAAEEEDRKIVMLLDVAVVCRSESAVQRPAMWQVLKMIHDVKESILMMDDIAFEEEYST